MDNVIHVAYALDDNYTMFTCISMTSLLYNTKRRVHFHVLESRLSEDNKQVLRDIGIQFSHGSWSFYNINSVETFITSIENGSHLTPETYYRLFLPSLLNEVDKVIWLDGDTVIDNDISELYDTSLEGFSLGAVVQDYESGETVLGLSRGTYIQAGVLLLDLTLLRNFGMYQKAIEAIPVLYDKFVQANVKFYADQEVLNHLFKNNYKMLSPKYNCYLCDYLNREIYSLNEYAEQAKRPVIIHLGGMKYNSILKLDRFIFGLSDYIIKKLFLYKNKTKYADISDDIRLSKYIQKREEMYNFLDPIFRIQLFRDFFFKKTLEVLTKQNIQNKKVAIWGANTTNYIHGLIITLASQGYTVDIIVDGISENREGTIWNKEIEEPNQLWSRGVDFFVLILAQTKETADRIKSVLLQNGYSSDDFYHVYETA